MRKFFLLVSCYLFLQFWIESILVSDDLIYDFLINQLSYERVSDMLAQGKKWKWLPYVLVPVLLFFKIVFTVICFSIAGLLINIEVGFKKFFSVATTAEFVFLIPVIMKLFWFSFINVNYTLTDLQFFSPLSVINFFDRATLEPWLVYPLSLLNLFEVAYIAALAYLMREAIGFDFAHSLKLVLASYGTGLLIWVIFITFLTVSLSA